MLVIPAKAGIQFLPRVEEKSRIPAFAEMPSDWGFMPLLIGSKRPKKSCPR